LSRLKKIASEETEDAKVILERIHKSSNNLKDIYYILFDNLNALFTAYPELYKQINMVVKLPSNDDAIGIANFDRDLTQILEHFEDETYLSEYVDKKEENE
jgi:hypothetical protein